MDSTEPMTLGSPIGSPTSSSYQTAQVLPGFLMGDNTLPPKSPASSVFFSSPSHLTGHVQPTSPMFRQVQAKDSFNTPTFASQSKINAPPTQSLADDIGVVSPAHLTSKSFHDRSLMRKDITRVQFTSPSVHNKSSSHNRSRQMINSPTQIDPFYTQGESLKVDSMLDDTWVTIFGFPSLSASYVLQKFALHGTIVCNKMAGAEGNYMHVKYESSLQAKKALSRNGKILPGNIMIGVTPCINLSVISQESLNRSNVLSSPQTTPRPVNLRPSLRPLTSAYQAASNENKVLNMSNTPQKSNGFITKAMDYMFG